LYFSWSALQQIDDPVATAAEHNPRPNSDDVFAHAMLIMVYEMGINANVTMIDRIPYDRILNGTVWAGSYLKTLQSLRIDKHNYLDMAAALVCRLDIGHDAALTFFKLLKKQNLEYVEATSASVLHSQRSHRVIPIKPGFLDEDPIRLHMPVPDEWGVNNLYVKFRATLGSRMNEEIYIDEE
jgi:hypothetical protein